MPWPAQQNGQLSGLLRSLGSARCDTSSSLMSRLTHARRRNRARRGATVLPPDPPRTALEPGELVAYEW
jgi:hypothetical protein